MSKNLFIAGTGTDIGKTYVTALIVKKLKEIGCNAAYYKAAMSGNERSESGNLIPGDAKWVKEISGISQPISEMCPYIYETAVSPHLASRIEGNPVKMDVLDETFKAVAENYDYITMEGSGGILCPISFDNGEIYLEDLIKHFGMNSLLIADAGLGTINSVVLTYEYMIKKNLKLLGIIFNNYDPENTMHKDNLFMCERLTGLNVIACVKHGDKTLDIESEKLIALYQ
ncbi:dethiobiotin synthetase [Lachnospiraceae bacterium KH1T2]|nr:dethiobiotin synthetase [Lachnospiraceae bacterium KH1T2]